MNKVIIAGSRTIDNYGLLLEAIEESGFNIDVVISGGAKGVDKLGERFAKENKLPLEIYLPKWNEHKGNLITEEYVTKCVGCFELKKNNYGYYNAKAGFERNLEMIVKGKATHAIILIRNDSKGSRNMIIQSCENKLNLFVKEVV